MTDAYEELAEIDVRAAINLMLRNPSYEPSAGRLRAETLLRKHNSRKRRRKAALSLRSE